MVKRRLVVLGVLVLALSLGIGTIAKAAPYKTHKSTIQMTSQEVELETFLERVIDIYPKSGFSRDDGTPYKRWRIEISDVVRGATYQIKFIPRAIRISSWHSYGYSYTVTMLAAYALRITPRNNIDGGRPIKLYVKVNVDVCFEDLEDCLEFQRRIFTAQKNQEPISLEVKLLRNYKGINEDMLKKGVYGVDFSVVFSKD